ncbi:MAG: glycosyltransferase family 4 protein [Elusimicrobia bacterium]|nr:glycosyltransferase family 4 protein [Elusimicrobiota bacterium]
MDRAPSIALVVGFKPPPDYGTTLYRALSAEAAGEFNLTAVTSTAAPAGSVSDGNVKTVWTPTWRHPFQIRCWLERNPVDLVHVQHEINLFGGWRGVLWLPLLLAFIKARGRRIVTTLHVVVPRSAVKGEFSGFFSFPRSGAMSWLMKVGLAAVYRAALASSDAVIVHSERLAGILVADYGGRPEKIRVVAHPELAVSAAEAPAPSAPTILYFGYLIRRKGIDRLIEAFASLTSEFPNHVLVLAGAAPQKTHAAELRAKIKSMGLERRVTLTGFVDADRVAQLFSTADAVALPAMFSYSASGPYAVAMAFDKPVIAPRLGVFAETIDSERDGLLYEPEDASALAAALRRVMRDAGLRSRLSEGMKRKRSAFSPEAVARATLAVYRDVLKPERRRPVSGTTTSA